MREEKFLFVHQGPPPTDGKEAAGRKPKFTKAWPNINPAAHGWAVMRAGRQQAFPSRPSYCGSGPAQQPSLAPWALHMTTTHPRFGIYSHIAFQGRITEGQGDSSGLDLGEGEERELALRKQPFSLTRCTPTSVVFNPDSALESQRKL